MKAVLEFDLNDPDDRIEHKRCVNSLELALCLWNMDEFLRTKMKYESDPMSQEVYDTYELIREKLMEICQEKNISIDELVN